MSTEIDGLSKKEQNYNHLVIESPLSCGFQTQSKVGGEVRIYIHLSEKWENDC